MIIPDAMKSLVDWKPVSERIMFAQFKTTKSRHLTFIQFYVPIEQSFLSEKEAFYMQHDKTFQEVRVGDSQVLSGGLMHSCTIDIK